METDKDDEHFENALIKECGLYYFGHGKSVSVRVSLEGYGWGHDLVIPIKNISKFFKIFECGYPISDKIEDGIYMHEIEGLPVRVMFDSHGILNSKIIGIANIISSDGGEDFFLI